MSKNRNKIPIEKFLSYELELDKDEKDALNDIIENEFLNYHDIYQTNKREPENKPDVDEITELNNLSMSIEPKENPKIVIIDQ